MLANTPFVHDTLTDVMTRGATTVDKKKLLFALGAKQDRQSAWGRLLDIWEELDQSRGALRGTDVWGVTLILTKEDNSSVAVALEAVSDWEKL